MQTHSLGPQKSEDEKIMLLARDTLCATLIMSLFQAHTWAYFNIP